MTFIKQISQSDNNTDIIAMLEKLNFTKNQSKVYLELIKQGESSAREICDKINVADSKIYKILRELEDFGLISIESQSPKTYRSIPLEAGLDNLKGKFEKEFKEKSQIIDNLRTLLTPIFNSLPETTKYALILNGKSTILNHIKTKLMSVTDNINIIFPNMYYFEIFKDLLDDLSQDGVKLRIGVSNYKKNTKLRFHIELMGCDAFYIIIDNKDLISISQWDNKDFMYAIVTTDENIINIMTSYFDNPACRLPARSQEIILKE